MQEKLLFVYNANSGKLNSLIDSAQKIINPDNYECSLCKITYGVLKENPDWKKFRTSGKYHMEFLHRDEFTQLYASKFNYKYEFPVVLIEENIDFQLLISSEELNKIKSVDELIEVIETRI